MKPHLTFKKFRNARSTNSKFVHFVPNQYFENNIKNTEQNRRGANEFHEVKIYISIRSRD